MANEEMTTTHARGFAAMDAERQREIASRGGKAAHAQGKAHRFTSEEAREAGRKGGNIVSQDRAHMAAIGRNGGVKRRRNAIANKAPGSTSPSVADADNRREQLLVAEGA